MTFPSQHESTMKRFLPLATLLLVAGCSQQPAGTTASTAAPAQTPVDAPLPRADIGIGYSLVQPPAYQRGKDMIGITVRVENRGKAVLSSAGAYPVHLGLVVLAPDATPHAPALRQDFVRVPLPRALAPGESADVAMRFPVAPAVGGQVVLDAVQERVAWFRGYGKPVLAIGTFVRCGDKPGTACTPDGTPLPVAH